MIRFFSPKKNDPQKSEARELIALLKCEIENYVLLQKKPYAEADRKMFTADSARVASCISAGWILYQGFLASGANQEQATLAKLISILITATAVLWFGNRVLAPDVAPATLYAEAKKRPPIQYDRAIHFSPPETQQKIRKFFSEQRWTYSDGIMLSQVIEQLNQFHEHAISREYIHKNSRH